MKNLVLGMLAIVMIFCAVSSALASVEKVTFAGIPWGSTAEEALQWLIDAGYLKETTPISSLIEDSITARQKTPANILSSNEKYYAERIILGKDYNDACIRIEQARKGFSTFLTQKTIANYQVFGIRLFFAYDGNETKLTTISIQLVSVKDDNIYNNLQEDHLNMYGDYFELTKSKPDDKFISKNSIWLGADDTCALIEYTPSDLRNDVYISYGTFHGIDMYEEAYHHLK